MTGTEVCTITLLSVCLLVVLIVLVGLYIASIKLKLL